jgi:hypothetical protein
MTCAGEPPTLATEVVVCDGLELGAGTHAARTTDVANDTKLAPDLLVTPLSSRSE